MLTWYEGIIGDDDSIIISPNDLAARLFVATVDARLYDIEITYKDVSTGSVDFNLQYADGTWQNGYSTIKRYDSGEIKNHIFRLNGRPGCRKDPHSQHFC